MATAPTKATLKVTPTAKKSRFEQLHDLELEIAAVIAKVDDRLTLKMAEVKQIFRNLG